MLGCAVCSATRAVPEQTEQVAPYSPNPSYALLVKDKLFVVPGIQMPFLVLRSVCASRTTGRTSCILTYFLHGIWEEECKNMSNLKYRALLNQTLRAVQLNKEKYRSLMF